MFGAKLLPLHNPPKCHIAGYTQVWNPTSLAATNLRVRLVEDVEKWEDRKW